MPIKIIPPQKKIKKSEEYKKAPREISLGVFLVEMTGLEPAASCSQSTRATSCATSRDYICAILYIARAHARSLL